MPTLNERIDDIPILASYFCNLIAEEYGMPRKTITSKAIEELMKITWTGNIRELGMYWKDYSYFVSLK